MNERRRYNCCMPLDQWCGTIGDSIPSISLLGRIDDNTILFLRFQKIWVEMGIGGVNTMVGIGKDSDTGGGVTQVDS